MQIEIHRNFLNYWRHVGINRKSAYFQTCFGDLVHYTDRTMGNLIYLPVLTNFKSGQHWKAPKSIRLTMFTHIIIQSLKYDRMMALGMVRQVVKLISILGGGGGGGGGEECGSRQIHTITVSAI